jgi:hypothetical protein
MSNPVRTIGVVEDFDGAAVRVGLDYRTITISAPSPGGNRLTETKLIELMTLLQQAYEDPQRAAFAEDEEDKPDPDNPSWNEIDVESARNFGAL